LLDLGRAPQRVIPAPFEHVQLHQLAEQLAARRQLRDVVARQGRFQVAPHGQRERGEALRLAHDGLEFALHRVGETRQVGRLVHPLGGLGQCGRHGERAQQGGKGEAKLHVGFRQSGCGEPAAGAYPRGMAASSCCV
jgi:hypothetical protein